MNYKVLNKINPHLHSGIERHTQKLHSKSEFDKIFNLLESQGKLKISGHALERLKDRNITLNNTDLDKLNGAVDKIRNKGGREALILYNNTAFITSIKNNTVITAIDSSSMKEHVFTNIDSAMIL